MKAKLFKNRAAWRAWLERNHDKQKEIWLAYYKKNSGKTSVTYGEALEEALCYGWIDSVVRKIDDEKYMQKYTPRKENSIWSASNKARVKRLILEGRMAGPGLKKIEAAKRNGSWNKLDKIDVRLKVPQDLLDALDRDKKAKEFFDKLPPSHKKQYSWWIISAKRPETRGRRIGETIKRLIAGRKPGM
jgi:uncharacterized protein YdeI (YjbR/CyaY-like superfamily)